MQSGDRAQERRLAGAVAPQQRDELSGRDARLDIVREAGAPPTSSVTSRSSITGSWRRLPLARLPDEGTDREMRARR
jgi:hypothetical protein